MAKQIQAFGIDDNTYGPVNHRIAPLESLLVEWANAADIVGVWPPANINVPSDLPVTFPAAHDARVEAAFWVTGTDPGGTDTVTVELLIDGVVVAGGPQTQFIFTSTISFVFSELSFTAAVGTGPQIRLTNNSAVNDVLIGDITTEFPSLMDLFDDFDEPAVANRGGFASFVY